MIQGIMMYIPYLSDDVDIMHSTRNLIELCQHDTVCNVRNEIEWLLSTYPTILSYFVYCRWHLHLVSKTSYSNMAQLLVLTKVIGMASLKLI